jgi:hypothetical protein
MSEAAPWRNAVCRRVKSMPLAVGESRDDPRKEQSPPDIAQFLGGRVRSRARLSVPPDGSPQPTPGGHAISASAPGEAVGMVTRRQPQPSRTLSSLRAQARGRRRLHIHQLHAPVGHCDEALPLRCRGGTTGQFRNW